MLSLEHVYRDLCCDLNMNSSDVNYIVKRLKNEGITFVTSTLPRFSRVVLYGIEIGNFYTAIQIQNFTHIAMKGRSLRYFRSLLVRIFCPKTGTLIENPDPSALYCIRTLCEYGYKLSLGFDDEKKTEQTVEFVRHDASFEDNINWHYAEVLRKSFCSNYKSFITEDPVHVLKEFPIRPGPGSYSESSADWYRWKADFYPKAPDPIVGDTKHVLRRSFTYPNVYDTRCVTDVGYSELLFVPKNADGPRTIVREPKTSLLYQLSFFDYFSSRLEKITNNHVNFVDQECNRNIARRSSIDRRFATIDLSKASDSVSYKLIRKVFGNHQVLRYFLNRWRSHDVKLPDGSFHRLRKLSGMGSGFTFPMMSFLAYHALCFAYSSHYDIPYKTAMQYIYTYGDDICVPRHFVERAYMALQQCGLVVNEAKSYSKGFFRESCGGDYFHGIDVGPPRLKLTHSMCRVSNKIMLTSPYERRTNYLCDLISHCKVLFEHGLFKLKASYEKYICTLLKVKSLPLCSNLNFNGIVSYSHSTSYRCDKTGTYDNIKVFTFSPLNKYNSTEQTYRKSLRVKPSSSIIDLPYYERLFLSSTSSKDLRDLRSEILSKNPFVDDSLILSSTAVPSKIRLVRNCVSTLSLI